MDKSDPIGALHHLRARQRPTIFIRNKGNKQEKRTNNNSAKRINRTTHSQRRNIFVRQFSATPAANEIGRRAAAALTLVYFIQFVIFRPETIS